MDIACAIPPIPTEIRADQTVQGASQLHARSLGRTVTKHALYTCEGADQYNTFVVGTAGFEPATPAPKV